MSEHAKEEPVVVPNCNVEDSELGDGENELEELVTSVDNITERVDQIEQEVVEVVEFYSKKEGSGKTSTSGGKTKGKHVSSPELMHQFATIIHQIAQQKWAWPFLEPVDVKGLGLHDYHKVIEKPMDLGTIKTKMDGLEYSNVREIYSDVRLVFKNAMKYNKEKDDVYVMAETLLENFQEKWLLIMPKLAEEEKKQAEEEAQEHANKAKNLNNELNETDLQLDSLRETVVEKCRKLSIQEKKELSGALCHLSPENLTKALQIVLEGNPSFPVGGPEIELNLDVLSDVTLWRLKVLVKEALKAAKKT